MTGFSLQSSWRRLRPFTGPLRSWWKEERATDSPAKRWASALIGAGLLLGGLRISEQLAVAGRDVLERDQLRLVQLLNLLRRHSVITATDWAMWDDTLAFAQGRNPSFLADSNLETTHLFRDGAVMAIHNPTGQLLA